MNDTKRTSLFLMANLGAEVSRIISAKKRGDLALVTLSLNNVDKMVAEIVKMRDMEPRVEEVQMLSQAIHAIAGQASDMQINPINIKSYFTPFALRLARNK